MGNWRRVQIVGTCDDEDVDALKGALDWSGNLSKIDVGDERWKVLGPLSSGGGLAGLPNWAQRSFSVVGNCFERDYSVDSIANHLETLAKVAPSLEVMVHCGADWEKEGCIATVRLKNGKAKKLKPKVKIIPEISESQMEGAMLRVLYGRQ